jgi:hypothetical protein
MLPDATKVRWPRLAMNPKSSSDQHHAGERVVDDDDIVAVEPGAPTAVGNARRLPVV